MTTITHELLRSLDTAATSSPFYQWHLCLWTVLFPIWMFQIMASSLSSSPPSRTPGSSRPFCSSGITTFMEARAPLLHTWLHARYCSLFLDIGHQMGARFLLRRFVKYKLYNQNPVTEIVMNFHIYLPMFQFYISTIYKGTTFRSERT